MESAEAIFVGYEDGRMNKYEYKVVNGYHLLMSA